MLSKQSVESLDDLEDPIIPPAGIEASTHPSTSMNRSSDTESNSQSERRDEVQEIRNRSRNEDRRVQLTRKALLFLILAIGATVSVLTYHFLLEEEHKAFNIAVSES